MAQGGQYKRPAIASASSSLVASGNVTVTAQAQRLHGVVKVMVLDSMLPSLPSLKGRFS
jgi:hypothetical protein